MPYINITETEVKAEDNWAYPREGYSRFTISYPMETKEEAEENLKYIIPAIGDKGVVIKLHMPAEEFIEKYQNGKGTNRDKKEVDELLTENEKYNQKHMLDAANSISQGMRDQKSPMSSLNPEIATNIATFFCKTDEKIEAEIQNRIEHELKPKI